MNNMNISLNDFKKNKVIDDAMQIVSILNKHADEKNCKHTISVILREVFDQ